ncbi:MAG: hypothetical protein WCV41_02650 [Patescibacteria group bacterium]
MENLKDKILAKIAAGEIIKKPRWQFLTKEFLIWFGVGVFFVIAIASSAAAIFNVQDIDWELRPRLHWGAARFIFISLPYFWLLGLVAVSLIAYYLFKHTKRGYRYALPITFAAIILLSFLAGCFAHFSFRGGRMIEQQARKGLPYYNDFLARPREAIWQQPERGFLAGEIISPYVDNKFELLDLNKKSWQVSCNPCLVRPSVNLQTDEKIKVIGQKIDNFNFSAEEIKSLFDINRGAPKIMPPR